MSERVNAAYLRKHVVPFVWTLTLVTAGLVFRADIAAWVTGKSSGGKKSSGLVLDAGAMTVEAALQPDPPKQKGNSLVLVLRDKDGGLISDAALTVMVTMPAMGSMSEMRTKAKVTKSGDGEYRARFDLAMGGSWTVNVEAKASVGELSASYTLIVGTSGLVAVSATGKAAVPVVPTHGFADSSMAEIQRALVAYEKLRATLAKDELSPLSVEAPIVASALRAAKVADSMIPGALAERLLAGAKAATAMASAADLGAARSAFATLSQQMVSLLLADSRLGSQAHAFLCPMTKGYNKWLQPTTELGNPYKGQDMYTCGSEIPLTEANPGATVHAHVHDPDEISHYTCPMDTWVKQKTDGTCPVCSMDLLPVTKEEVRTGVMRIDHRRRQLIGLKTGLVERRELNVRVNAVGRVTYDETRLAEVTLKYDGWIQKLYVEQTGAKVRKGQTLMTVYSPEVYAAQQEYLLALSHRDASQTDRERARAELLVNGSKQRLRLWDVSNAQLARIAKRGKPLQYIPVVAPATGYLVAKDVIQGGAVKSGQRLFRIAALDRVWVEADVYEQDIPHVKVGQAAHVTLSHLSGQTFEGKVSFIYPYLDGSARTSRARIELDNSSMALKPEMYANVELRVALGERIVVPEAAVVYSGPRRVVFLDMDDDRLQPKAIEVGVKSDGYFEVISGLEEGQRVVTSGNFLLSAESRLKSATGLW